MWERERYRICVLLEWWSSWSVRERTRGKYRRERKRVSLFQRFCWEKDEHSDNTNTNTHTQRGVRLAVCEYGQRICYHDSTRGEMLYDVVWPYFIYKLLCLLRLLVEETFWFKWSMDGGGFLLDFILFIIYYDLF